MIFTCSVETLSPEDAFQQKGDILLLDVRTPSEYNALHVEGSVLRPLTALDPHEIRQLSSGKDSCVVICAGGTRARQAAERLKDFDLPHLSVLEGGVQAWGKAGLPLVRGRRMMSLERQVRITAGSLMLISDVLGYFVNSYFFAVSGFVGAGLVFAGITDTCGMGMLLARMPWNNRKSAANANNRATTNQS
jgi:rhodanese-related sulfurtransferase